MPEYSDALQARNGLQENILNRGGQGGRDAIGVDAGILQAFGLEEDLVAGPVGEPGNLVFDRGTITRSATGNGPAIDRRLHQIVGDNPVRRLGRAGHAAFDLGHGDAIGQERKRDRCLVGRLHVETRPVDGATIKPRRCAGLETAHAQAQTIEFFGQAVGRGFPVAAGGNALLATMDDTFEEGAGGQHHAARRPAPPVIRRHAAHMSGVVDEQVFDRGGLNGQIGLLGQRGLHGLSVKPAVALGARAAHGGPLGPVEQAELNARGIGHTAHQPVERIDFADQMALAESANRRIAGHFANGFDTVGQEQGTRAKARGRRRSLTARVPAPDNNDIPVRHGSIPTIRGTSAAGRFHSPLIWHCRDCGWTGRCFT